MGPNACLEGSGASEIHFTHFWIVAARSGGDFWSRMYSTTKYFQGPLVETVMHDLGNTQCLCIRQFVHGRRKILGLQARARDPSAHHISRNNLSQCIRRLGSDYSTFRQFCSFCVSCTRLQWRSASPDLFRGVWTGTIYM